MQTLIEFLPLIAFLIAYQWAGLYAATATLMVAMAMLLGVNRWRTGKIAPLHLASATLVFVLGGATLLLRDERFIIWKPTVLFWALALGCLASLLAGGRTLIERLMTAASAEAFVGVARGEWVIVTAVWAAFYAVLGALNLWVAWNFAQTTWVNFKVFGITGATLVFVIMQTLWLARRGALGASVETEAKREQDTP